MALDLDYFLKINNTYGTSSRKDTQLYNLKNHVNDRFTDTIDCYNVKLNNTDRELLIVRTTKQNQKKIKSRPTEDFDIGDYVSFDNNYWLIISKDECDQVYTSGIMQLCNYTLLFQSSDGTILSYPCITDGKSYSNDENKVITLESNQKSALLPYDEHTARLKVDRRLYIDKRSEPTPYKIIGDPDTTTYNYGSKGMIYFVAQKDVEQITDGDSPKDRPDLGVCNYFAPTPPTPVGTTHSTITTSGDLIIDGTRTVTATAYNADGTVNTGISLVWVITEPTEFESDITCTVVGNTCTVTILENYETIDAVIKFEVSDGSGGYVGSKEFVIGA